MITNKYHKTNKLWLITCATICFIGNINVFAQTRMMPDYNGIADFLRSNPVEKLYLHTDRNIYAENDTIWFSAYLVNAHNLNPDNAPLRNIYVELIDQDKNVAARNMIAATHGFSFGDFNISSYKIIPGKYNLRAYTAYQTNFSEDFLFNKEILITPVYNQKLSYHAYYDSIITTNNSLSQNDKNEYIDLQFLPEGGVLTESISNTLAFKAINNNGVGVNITGTIYDNLENKITSFETSHCGMGKIRFKPEANKTYYAKITNSQFKYALPSAKNLLLMTVSSNDSIVNIRLKTNTLKTVPKWYYIVATSRGLVYYSTKILVDKPYQIIIIPTNELSMGINQFTILNSDLVPLRDRLVFIDNAENIDIQLSTFKETSQKQEKINVSLKVLSPDSTPVKNTSISVTVTDKSLSQNIEEYPQNIQSWLLLNSDLKGTIENPSYYFDSENENVIEHLDLVMLTHGWSSYNWNTLADSLPEKNIKKQYGITLSGTANQFFLNKKLKNTEMTMSMMQDDMLFYDTIKTDGNANFSVPNLVLPDSTEIVFAFPEKKNMKQYVSVQTFIPPYTVQEFNNFTLPEPEQLENFNLLATQRYEYDKAINPEKYDILLEEIVVKKEIEDIDRKDEHLRPYPKADRAIITSDKDLSYSNILFFVSRNIPRVVYDGQSLYIKGLASGREKATPALLLDGMEVDLLTIENFPIDVVAKVEVVYEPSSLIMWPHNSKAQKGGVISVFTKRQSDYDKLSTSDLAKIVRGYYQSRKFYSPKFINSNNQKGYDSRSTLLWIPIIKTNDEGIAGFSFFNTKNSSAIQIEAEGLSPDGMTGTAKTDIKSDKIQKQ
jgi:hypothetical protein